MTNNTEQSKPSNKKLWLILAGISITVIGSSLLFFGLASGSSNKNPEEQTKTQQSIGNLATPRIDMVETTVNAQELSFHIEVKDFDPSRSSLEYQISDQDREIKDEGKVHTADVDASVKLGNSAYYRIKVRTVTDAGMKSEWSENYTVKLADLDGFKSIEPNPDYYSTGWAIGSDVSLEGAKNAIKTAWNAEEISNQNELHRCLPVNTGEMTSKLLLPPIPSVMPKQVTLNFMTNSWDGSAISITYLWCEN